MDEMLKSVLADTNEAPSRDDLIRAFQEQFGDSDDMLNLFSLRSGKVIVQNAAAQSQIGYDDNDIQDKSISDFHPEDQRIKAEMAFRQMLRFGFAEAEVTMYLKSGELATLLLRSFLIQRVPEAICLTHTVRITL